MFAENGSEYIANAIAEAVAGGTRQATIRGHWEIESAIRIPSGFTLILENCHLKMADGVFDNMFVNEHHDTAVGRTTAGTDRNIIIEGHGMAIIDGGTYNGLSERNQLQDGRPPIWKNNLLLFTNVDGFRISGLQCHNQRWWALNFIYCCNGRIEDVEFQACDIGIDANGQPYHGLKRDKYEEVLVKNADGIDLRQGCHHIQIENIRGYTEDDTIALTGLNGRLEQAYAVEGVPKDICHVTIKEVHAEAYCTNVRLLNQGDVKLHDIEIDGVYDTSENSMHMDRGIYGVRVGDVHMYGTRHATEDETYNITIRNVRSRGIYAVCLAGAIKNLVMENIECWDGAKMLEDQRKYIDIFIETLKLPEESRSSLRSNYEVLINAAGAAAILKTAEEAMYNGADWRTELVPYMDRLSAISGLHRYVVDFLFMVQASEALREKYAEQGLSDELFWDTIADLKYKLIECHDVYGIWGTFVAHWHPWFYTMRRFKLGRMQYEQVEYSGPSITLGKYTVNPGDTAYNFHIPSCGPMGRELRMDSYKKAYEFFGMTGKPMVFVCHSWLLYPDNRKILPEHSNVVDFIDDFHIYDSKENDFPDRWRVYGADFEKPDAELPEDTNMRRCFKQWLLEGKKTGEGWGVFVYDGERFWK